MRRGFLPETAKLPSCLRGASAPRQATALRRATRAVAQRGGGPPPPEASPPVQEEVLDGKVNRNDDGWDMG